MKTNICLCLLTIAACLLATTANGSEGVAQTAPAIVEDPPRIGIYDSRSVATAYCGTARHEAEIQRLDVAVKQAKEADDPAQIKQAENAVWAARKRLLYQGSGTHSVDNILDQIPDEVARIKHEMEVMALVSKWDSQTLLKHKKAERVDVTEKLIDALKPNERQRRYAMEIRNKMPVPAFVLELLLKKEGH